MNIFILDNDPDICAQMHADKHVVKMITESTQILCTVLHLSGSSAPYRKTHVSHPCVRWASASLSNWLWLRDFVECLHKEYQYRYGNEKQHKSAIVAQNLAIPSITDNGLTPFSLVMPEQYKTDDAVQSYRNYYKNEKQHLFSFKFRSTPSWLISP